MTVNMATVQGNIGTLSGSTTSLGRIWFKLSRPDWNDTGNIFAPEYVEAVAGSLGNFTVQLQSTDDFEQGSVYSAILRYRDIVDGKDKEFLISQFAVPTGGPWSITQLLIAGTFAPVPADILALAVAAQLAAESAALTASTAATDAATYAQVDFPTHAAAVAYVAGSGTFIHGHSYSVAGVRYVGMTGATGVPDLPGLTLLPPGLRLRNPASGKLVTLLMGQSWPVGADSYTTGTAFAANSKVRVWKESTGTWIVPAVGAEPFNPSGADNEGLNFCNRQAEDLPFDPYFYLIADGGISIADWVGTPADRSITVGNRPKWVELQTAMTNGLLAPDLFIWHQGVKDHALSIRDYQEEFRYLLEQMTSAGYLTADTPVLVVQAPNGDDRSGDGLSFNSYRTNNLLHALRGIGDPRIRLVDTTGVPAPYETVITDTFSAHFSDAGVRIIGRERIYAAWHGALIGVPMSPLDPGQEMVRTRFGFPGHHSRVDRIVGAGGVASPYSLMLEDLSGCIRADAGSTLILPDFNKSSYTSAMDGSTGIEVDVYPHGAGTYTFQIEGGSTGWIFGIGAFARATTASSVAVTLSAADAYIPFAARWVDGAGWHIAQKWAGSSQLGSGSYTYDLPSLVNDATHTITGLTLTGLEVGDWIDITTPSNWGSNGIIVEAVWVTAADTFSVTVRNISGVTKDVANAGFEAFAFFADI